MHEHALMQDLVAEIERLGRSERARRITRVDVRLGALSHFTPAHFREHFADASRGTLAEGAAVHAELDADVHAPRATGVVLESVEVEA
ncbi:MAG TPA: hydrogenase/urease maturation nickel metallochaperone HypA [Gaiellaceae bacterium]|nr:hydrogenase/urease maturation nickel metallochaperone HypA [Gaiellaceae bacterium]